MELLLSAAPFWKKKGGGWTWFFFLFHFSFITYHYHYCGTIMPNCQPQSTFPQQEKHIQCYYILGRNNGTHEYFTKRKIMYNTAILLAVSLEEWTFQEKHIQHCYILGRYNGAYKHFTKRKIMYNTAILLVILLTRRMNFSIHNDTIYSQWRLHHFILLTYKTILANLERRWWMMTQSI